MRRLGAGVAALALLALVPARGEAAVPVDCDGPEEPGGPDFVADGTFDTSIEGDFVMVPFTVPDGMTRVRLKICHDAAPVPGSPVQHTLDLGVYEPLHGAGTLWGRDEFRGWGGSNIKNQLVTPELASTSRTHNPGPIPAGTWAAEIGVANLAGPDEGDPDGSVGWRLEVFWRHVPSDLDEPYTPPAYDPAPKAGPGWYAGDFHVHGPNSSDGGGTTMEETLDDAFDRAGLDFIALSDHNVTRGWDSAAAFQGRHPGKLVLRSAEVTTYRGHVNAHAALEWIDYRTSTVWERRNDGSLAVLRPPVAPGAPGALFDQTHATPLGWAQVNHPTIFPSKVPAFANLCRGCSWEYSDQETDWSKVDAFEVQTGPAGTPDRLHPQQPLGTDGTLGPNPFTPLAVEWFDRLQRDGFDITAVGSSDSHRDDFQDLTTAPIGEATTVVFAPELSEAGIREGTLAGHAYVKMFGNDGPDLRLTAVPTGGGAPVMMGDELAAGGATFTARVLGTSPRPSPLTLLVVRDGLPYLTAPVTSADFTFTFAAVLPGDYRLQLMRGTAIEALTNPINLVAPGAQPPKGHGGKPSEPGPPDHAPAHGRRPRS